MPEGTAACRIAWGQDRAIADAPLIGCTDARLDDLISGADVIGIDAPFGWPVEFTAAVGEWSSTEWNPNIRDRLQFRETDREVKKSVGRWPLSVSSDRIALPAMRAMALLKRYGISDRSGEGRFFEIYPAGSLGMWKITNRGYKEESEDGCSRRTEILRALRGAISGLEVPDSFSESADGLDSLVAALTVRAAARGQSLRPDSRQKVAARYEDWIRLPTALPEVGRVHGNA